MLRAFEPFPFKNFESSREVVRKIREVIMCSGGINITTDEEQTMLYEISSGLHGDVNTGIFVEFGSYCGSSATIIGAGLKEARSNLPLITIDVYAHDDVPGSKFITNNRFYIGRYIFRDLGLSNYVCQVAFDDVRFFETFLMGFPVQFVFLDSDHGYEGVLRQLNLIMPKVVRGGWCVIHDYREKYQDRVVKAINEFIDTTDFEMSVFQMSGTVCIQKQ